MRPLFYLYALLILVVVAVACGRSGSALDQTDAQTPSYAMHLFDSCSRGVPDSRPGDTLVTIQDTLLTAFSFPRTILIPLRARIPNGSNHPSDSLYVVPYPVWLGGNGTTIETSAQGLKPYVFQKPFTIEDCDIGEMGSSKGCPYKANLNWSDFQSRFIMAGNDFYLNFRIANCIFSDTAIFVNPSYQPLAVKEKPSYVDCSFASCIFKKGLTFDDRFLEDDPEAPLIGSRIKNDLYFFNCQILGKLDLSECHFDSSSRLIFALTPLPDTLDLENTKFTAPIDLMSAKLRHINRKCEINLIGCDIDKLKLGYGNFHLYIPPSIDTNEYYRDQIGATYEALLNNLQKNGFKDSYRQLAIEYKDWQAKRDFFTWVSGLWWCYGFRKWHLLYWTFGFLLVFSLLNLFLYKRIFATYPIEELKMDGYDFSANAVIRFLQQLLITGMYTGWIFFKLSIDFDKIKIQRLGWLFIILIEYLIGILCTAYLVNWIVSR